MSGKHLLSACRARPPRGPAGVVFLAAAIALTTAACSDEPAKPFARVYTGDLTGTDVRVGIIATEHRARLFFCGGASSYQTMTGWLTADVDAAHQLSIPSDAAKTWGLQGRVADTEVTGAIDKGDGMSRPFRATVVSDRTISGLYEGTAPCGRLGLIVTQPSPDMSPSGQGACVGPVLEQVNPLEPIIRDPDGTIRVKVGGSDAERQVRPATPPPE
jgi:hypothetical protein